jgi:hypothetical protein
MSTWNNIYDNSKYFMKNLTYIAIWSSGEKVWFVFILFHISPPSTISQQQNEITYLPLRRFLFLMPPFFADFSDFY